MIPHSFGDRPDPAVADTEPFARHPSDIGFPIGGAVKRHVADDDVVFGCKGRPGRRVGDDFPAGQALAKVVVGVAFEFKGHTRGHKRAKALTG